MTENAAPSRQSDGRPDLLVIVMDCVRSPEFSIGSPAMGAMPYCRQLGRESLDFRRTVAPGSWTIPSHASLFTGLYPWDHRLHSRGVARLPAGTPNLAESLGRAGYRTASFSSNPFVGELTGLTDGFDAASWGGWWERYARHLHVDHPPGGKGRIAASSPVFAAFRRSPAWPVARSASRLALRHPALLHASNRLLQGLFGAPTDCPSCVYPWIESALGRWLGAQDPATPTFAFVNLMEAHEPYMLSGSFSDARSRRRAANVPQEFGDWLEGRWTPSPNQIATLRDLYQRSIQAIDHRVQRIVEIYERAGRWASTALVLTSDHGQAFGEDGVLSHGMSVGDAITRIPLWLRLPGAEFGGESTDSWASLIDVAPTLRSLAGIPGTARGDGVDLRTLRYSPRSGPVWSMAEGVIWPEPRAHMAADRLERFDRVRIAGFLGDTKVSCDGTGEMTSVRNLSSLQGAEPPSPSTVAEMIQGMREHLQLLETRGPSSEGPEAETLARLKSWGYV